MTRPPAIVPNASRAARALLLIAVLVLGTVAHAWHHVQDPDCGSGRDGNGHVCVACAGLHGSTLVAHAQPAPLPQRAVLAEAPASRRAVPAFATPRTSAPRAPPAA